MLFFRRAIDLLLPRADQARVVAAIGEAEQRTTGEIKIHVETRCKEEALTRAQTLFHRLGMDKVKARNGVLIYVAVKDHKFALFGDAAIASKVEPTEWDAIAQALRAEFKTGHYAEGLIAALTRVGRHLETHFPATPGSSGGGGVVSNQISGR